MQGLQETGQPGIQCRPIEASLVPPTIPFSISSASGLRSSFNFYFLSFVNQSHNNTICMYVGKRCWGRGLSKGPPALSPPPTSPLLLCQNHKTLKVVPLGKAEDRYISAALKCHFYGAVCLPELDSEWGRTKQQRRAG